MGVVYSPIPIIEKFNDFGGEEIGDNSYSDENKSVPSGRFKLKDCLPPV